MREVTDTTTFTPLRRGAHMNAESLGDTNPYTLTGFRLYSELPKGMGTEKLGSGEVDAILGDGPMTRVYRIVCSTPPRIRVVKIALPGLADEIMAVLRHRWERWRTVKHPNIPRAFNTGAHNGLPFVEMEYVRGRSVQNLVELHSSLPPHVCTAIALMVTQATVHCCGDGTGDARIRYLPSVEPRDVIVGKGGLVKLVELLIPGALVQGAYTAADRILDLSCYLSPELSVTGAIDADDGVYGIGALMWFMLAGRTPFKKRVPEEILQAKERGVRTSRAALLFTSSARRHLLRLSSLCLAPDPTSRPPLDVLQSELERHHAHLTTFPTERIAAAAVNETDQWPPARR